jgi:hypothetical protein
MEAFHNDECDAIANGVKQITDAQTYMCDNGLVESGIVMGTVRSNNQSSASSSDDCPLIEVPFWFRDHADSRSIPCQPATCGRAIILDSNRSKERHHMYACLALYPSQ